MYLLVYSVTWVVLYILVYTVIVVVLHLLVNSVTGTMLHLLVYCLTVEVVIVSDVLGDGDGIVFTGELRD